MIWREGQNHVSDCYFCMLNINGSYICSYICSYIEYKCIFYTIYIIVYV